MHVWRQLARNQPALLVENARGLKPLHGLLGKLPTTREAPLPQSRELSRVVVIDVRSGEVRLASGPTSHDSSYHHADRGGDRAVSS